MNTFCIERISFDAVRSDSNGFKLIEAVFARVGVLDYPEYGQKHFFSPEVLKDSASDYIGLPLMYGHPKDGKLITPKNIKKEDLIGFIVDCYFDGTVLKGIISVIDERGLKALRNESALELSCGYGQKLIESPGVWIDEQGLRGEKEAKYPYTHIKGKVKANHIALVEEGRAEIARVVMDSSYTLEEDSISFDAKSYYKQIPLMTTKTIIFDDIDIEVGEDSVKDVTKLINQVTSLTEKLDTQSTEFDSKSSKFQEKIDYLTGQVDTLKAEIETNKSTSMDSASFDSALKNRLGLWQKVQSLNLDVKFDPSMDEKAIQIAGLTAVLPEKASAKLKEASPAYVAACWDMKMEDMASVPSQPTAQVHNTNGSPESYNAVDMFPQGDMGSKSFYDRYGNGYKDPMDSKEKRGMGMGNDSKTPSKIVDGEDGTLKLNVRFA